MVCSAFECRKEDQVKCGFGWTGGNEAASVFSIEEEDGFPVLRKSLGISKLDREPVFQVLNSLGITLPFSDADIEKLNKSKSTLQEFRRVWKESQCPESIRNFLIYSPEYSKLRTFEAEGQILPLGAGGEGLFRLLRVIAAKDPAVIDEIKEKLAVVGWFEDFITPENGDDSLERSLRIKDRYLHEDLAFFNQKSANEGFLFLLFYYCLFLSSFTPSFFAIDNVDASLNPRLCVRLMKDIVEMAKANGKQVILTTHNPAILDGLNLADDEQRLFSVYRSATGETQITRILPQKEVPGTKPVPLSEAFVKGYLGGLPDNF
jgi:predicted ATPase